MYIHIRIYFVNENIPLSNYKNKITRLDGSHATIYFVCLIKIKYMSEFRPLGPPVRYSPVPLRPNQNKLRILLIIFGCILLLIIIIILILIIFKSKKTTMVIETTMIIETTVSTQGEIFLKIIISMSNFFSSSSFFLVSIISNNAQCPASNCDYGATCCLNNDLPEKIHCCTINVPICCPPDQGWCCRIEAPVCCGKFSCCRLNHTCCTVNDIEQCCPISDNIIITTNLFS